ncbi:hypothetical protein A6E01_20655 (plasmid) [Vibrio breoganii]|uniref:Uncharacterized protein n=1 Tax=Vibrio breoganii TaxID=553239 RepID=A0AAN0XZQ7_9VIBR|nr:hypothetical protein A6E01_20655 [Vibrio breoganii]
MDSQVKIWIESDCFGNRHVMVKRDPLGSFCYCTFYYKYPFVCNAAIDRTAEAMAISLGASHPVAKRVRNLGE